MAHQGWDSLTIDLQHGVVDYPAMVTMLQAISTTPTVPVVRVPWLEPGILMKTLDAGAYGVICPMVNTREDAQKLVAYTHYAPRGTRSFGPVRALLYGGADYAQHANDTIVTFAMIETAAGARQPRRHPVGRGLDAIYIGPSDLSLALGCTPTFDDLDPKAAEAVDHILARAKAHGVVAGIHNGTPRSGAGAHRQGLPVRHRQLRRAADGRRRAAGGGDDARRPAGAGAGVAATRHHSPTKDTHMNIGFIGLGIMGTPMALHLVDAGHELFVNTLGKLPEAIAARRPCACASADGGRAPGRGRLHDGARHARRRGRAVRRARRRGRAAGLAARARSIVDMSSISPMATKAFAKKINALGADYIDAPVSGGEVGAKAASLTIMCGGDEAVFERVRPLFEKMGKNITLVGGNGDGQTTKVANQIIVALNIAAVGEALLFASKAGADPAKVRQALMGGFAAEPHPRGARRTHDQAHVRAGLPHPAAPEGPGPGAAGRARTRRVAAADGRRGAADAGLRRQRHGRPRPLGAGEGAGADGGARSRPGLNSEPSEDRRSPSAERPGTRMSSRR